VTSVVESLRLEEVVRHHAERRPDDEALIYERAPFAGTTVTWAGLDRWVDAAAGALRLAGVRPGDRVAVFLKDDPACIAAIYGVMRAGGVLIPIDPKWGVLAIATVLQCADVHFFLAQTADEVFEGARVDRGYESRFATFCERPSGEVPRVSPEGGVDDLAMIAFTSGTTSGPKGVMLRHRHLQEAYASCRRCLGFETMRRFGCSFRLSGLGVLGTGYLLAHGSGAASVVLPELTLETTNAFWASLVRHDIEFVYLVPALVQLINRLAEPPPAGARRPLVMVGAAPISAEALDTFQRRFDVRVRNCYGLTEASFAVFFGQEGPDGFGTLSIGRARGIEARLLDSNHQVVEGAGSGLLQFRGPMVSEGYWRNEAATRELFDDGWMVTGDIAERDAEGGYYIRGRAKDVVIRGGFNIHLQEVDEALLSHPAVLGACSVGAPDRVSGEEVYVLVKLREGADLKEATLLEWCKAQLGEGRSPRRIVFSAEDMPRNGAGKVVRREALAKIAERLRLRL
jgi:acyl-CoA synthetase (AMP-forming)/AMP-acid ligase II